MIISSSDIVKSIPSDVNSIYVAYSGGVDSHVLLHLLSQTSFRPRTKAVYINHGLQTQASEWEQHCAAVCLELQIDFQSIAVNVSRQPGESLEEAARNARYFAFKQIMRSNDLLLTGHHRDDQAETFFLQLLRGSGVAGLAGMSFSNQFAEGELQRPLLGYSRSDVMDYAVTHNLLWVDDPSNQQQTFDRNYLRHTIMPLLRERWPSVDKTVARSAAHCADLLGFIDEFTDTQLPKLLSQGNCLDCRLLAEYRRDQQLLLIRSWIKINGLRPASQAATEAILEQIVLARHDAEPFIAIQDHEVRRYRNQLHCISIRYLRQSDDLPKIWHTHHAVIRLDNGQCLIAEPGTQGIKAELWHDKKIEIKRRQGGEKLRLPHRQGQRELKKLYQEAGVPPWERDLRPIIYMDGQIAAIAGLWVDESVWADNGPCIQLRWQFG